MWKLAGRRFSTSIASSCMRSPRPTIRRSAAERPSGLAKERQPSGVRSQRADDGSQNGIADPVSKLQIDPEKFDLGTLSDGRCGSSLNALATQSVAVTERNPQ